MTDGLILVLRDMKFNVDVLLRFRDVEAETRSDAVEYVIIESIADAPGLVIGNVEAIEAETDSAQCPHCDAYAPVWDDDKSLSHRVECPNATKSQLAFGIGS